jgi:hypothetical protein
LTACYRTTSTAPELVSNDPAVDGTAESLVAGPNCENDDLEQPVTDAFPEGRLRTHIDGPLTGWTWAGLPLPSYVPPRVDTLELLLADHADGGTLAFYREPYELGSCTLGDGRNCAYVARFYDARGKKRWALNLSSVLSRPDHIEVQDIRLSNGVLYLNEACQSYSREAGGTCSRLVAIDPVAKQVLWRTDPLVSNGRFRVRGCYIVAGYGFTAEPDFLHLVDRGTGKVVQRIPISSSAEQLTLLSPDRLDATLYSGVVRRYRLVDVESNHGSIAELDAPERINASYGGAGYGGAGYGAP